jgi:hypothetical protein
MSRAKTALGYLVGNTGVFPTVGYADLPTCGHCPNVGKGKG